MRYVFANDCVAPRKSVSDEVIILSDQLKAIDAIIYPENRGEREHEEDVYLHFQ